MEKKSFRKRVMMYAHNIYAATKRSWRRCLIKAWELYRLAKKMRERAVRFAYEKVDGSVRLATGTLCDLPAGVTSGKGKPSYKTFAYYDIDKQQFRCFKIENLLTIY